MTNIHKDHLVHKVYAQNKILQYNKELDIWEYFNTTNEYYYTCLTCAKILDNKEIDF